jgi:hypothetical protein
VDGWNEIARATPPGLETVPEGTMEAIEVAVKAWDKWDTDLRDAPPAEWIRAMLPLEAILTRHRATQDGK